MREKINIEILSSGDHSLILDRIAKILTNAKIKCNMDYIKGIDRTEYLSEFDE